MVTPQTTLTASNRGPIVNIVAWVTLIAACLATSVKVGIRYARIRGIKLDDIYMLGALVAALAETVAAGEQVKYGLGRHIEDLSESQLQAMQRANYVSGFFYIASICLARLGVLQYLSTIALSKARNALTKGVIAFNLLWATAAILAVSFQCSLPRAWEVLSDHCFNQPIFWDVIEALDITLDILLAALTTILISHVKMSWTKKSLVIGAFSVRILIMPWIILRLNFFRKASNSSDPTFDHLDTSIMTTLVVNLGVVAACVPFSKPFADYVQSGVLGAGLRIKSSEGQSSEDSPVHVLHLLSVARQQAGDGFLRIPEFNNPENVVTTNNHSSGNPSPLRNSSDSQDMIIKHTTGFTVDSQPRGY